MVMHSRTQAFAVLLMLVSLCSGGSLKMPHQTDQLRVLFIGNSLVEYSRRFANEIRLVKAKPALYMVWPSASRMQDFNGVIESYKRAAEEIEGLLFPVGEAWLRAWKRDPKLELYSSDGLHPTMAGTYLAASVIFEHLYDESAVGLPSKFKLRSRASIEIPKDQARTMQEAAAEVKKRKASPSKAA